MLKGTVPNCWARTSRSPGTRLAHAPQEGEGGGGTVLTASVTSLTSLKGGGGTPANGDAVCARPRTTGIPSSLDANHAVIRVLQCTCRYPPASATPPGSNGAEAFI